MPVSSREGSAMEVNGRSDLPNGHVLVLLCVILFGAFQASDYPLAVGKIILCARGIMHHVRHDQSRSRPVPPSAPLVPLIRFIRRRS